MDIGPRPVVSGPTINLSNRWAMYQPRRNRSLPIAAIGGAILLFVGTWLHPMQSDPNVPLAAFTEYAADRHWTASHLMQLSGVALMVTALVLLSRIMAGGTAETAALLGSCGAIASLAVAAVLQAIDGVALKAMVNAWAAAPAREKEMLFSAAFAVRQVEIGLASMTALLSGLTISIFGIALMRDPRFPTLLGIVGIAGGITTTVAGVVMAYTGFSDRAMNINLPANLLVLCWMIALGVYVWREPVRLVSTSDSIGASALSK
jgi:hypothetical protein